MEHYFNLNGQFRTNYSEDKADIVKSTINNALTMAFEKLEVSGVVSSTSQFMSPGWWFHFEEFNNNLHKETIKCK